MIEMGKNYECFSKKLYGFLTMKGVRYEREYKHHTTGRTCWVYVMTPELSRFLKEWADQNPAKKGA